MRAREKQKNYCPMKDIRVHIKVERYIKEWLIFHFGNPVRFPDRSFENEVLHRMLTRRPPNEPPELPSDDTVSIVITDNKHRRPEFYNHLGFHGQRTIVSAIDGLFRISLWSGCFPLIHSKGELNKGIDLWCEQNGISLDAREAVRQKFYRLRKQYHEKGVIVGKIYHKKKSTYLSQIVQTDKNKSHG